MRPTARAALSSQVERDAGKEPGVFKNITPLSIPTSVHTNALRIKKKNYHEKHIYFSLLFIYHASPGDA